MTLEQDTVSSFQQNRAKTFAASKPWLWLMAIGFIGGLFISNVDSQSSAESLLLGIGFLILSGISIVRLTYIIRAYYRCPACGEIPMLGWGTFGPSSFGFESGVNLNPRSCPNCGAKLK